MSQKKLFIRGLGLGYIALVTNILYSLLSIPLALRYLDKQSFGLWALITAIASYLSLAELGMINAFNRQLIEHKKNRENGQYGTTFIAGLMVFAAIGILVTVLGSISSLYLSDSFNIPSNLTTVFRITMMGQSLICATSLATTMLRCPLYINQRQDLIQISQIILFILHYAILWFGFHSGLGIYAMLLKDFVGLIFSLGFSVYFCFRLGFYPKKHEIKRPCKNEFSGIFVYARDSFLMQMGEQVVNGLPMLLLPKLLGLEASATWTVATRPFFILRQVLSRPFEYGVISLCDMFVAGNLKRMTERWLDVSRLMLTGSVVILPVAAANNARFMEVWTHGKISLAPQDHWFFALYFLVTTLGVYTIGMVGIDKKFGKIRYVHFAEAFVILCVAYFAVKTWGLSGMIILITAVYILLRCVVGIMYMSKISKIGATELATQMLLKYLILLPVTCGIAAGFSYVLRSVSGWSGLILSASLGTISCGSIAILWGIPSKTKNEILDYTKTMSLKLISKKNLKAANNI